MVPLHGRLQDLEKQNEDLKHEIDMLKAMQGREDSSSR